MNGFIGFFDILGYQNFLRNNSAEESLRKVFNIINTLPEEVKKSVEERLMLAVNERNEPDWKELIHEINSRKNELGHLVFSDTIVLTLPLKYQEKNTIGGDELMFSFGIMMECASVLVAKMHEAGLPVRGVIHQGEFFIDKTCLGGTGIVEAYKSCELINFSGLVLSEKLNDSIFELLRLTKQIKSNSNLEISGLEISNDGGFYSLFTQYAPMRDGNDIKLIHVNWMDGMNNEKNPYHQMYLECCKDVETFVLKAFWAHQKDCPKEVDAKIHNTVKLIRKMIYNNNIKKDKEKRQRKKTDQESNNLIQDNSKDMLNGANN